MAEGVWGTSPHLIPHFALHSASGSISLALGSHGPNLGVGGGRRAVAEGFLAALTWLSTGTVPGVWLVLSGWSPELVPDPAGNSPQAGECLGLALALVGLGNGPGGPAVRITFGADSCRESDHPPRSCGDCQTTRRGVRDYPRQSRPTVAGGCVSSWLTDQVSRDKSK